MRKLASALLLALPLFAQTPANANDTNTNDSRVTIGLAQYETMRRELEAQSTTVIDTILLGGSFASRDLSIEVSGRTTGTRPRTKILEQTNDVTIYGCSGNAIFIRSGKGAFDIIPLANDFAVRCELRISGSDRLSMHATPAVLAVRSSVTDGELVSGDEDDTGARDFTLVRHVAGRGEVLPATATGHYLITLLPDATRFRYTIQVHNPNRTTSALSLNLQSNEHLQEIDSAAPYEVGPSGHTFSIPPG
ncbi:MAG: hypothetical protein ACLGH0_14795, partial [Thermoanaerobaculia bacterium]